MVRRYIGKMQQDGVLGYQRPGGKFPVLANVSPPPPPPPPPQPPSPRYDNIAVIQQQEQQAQTEAGYDSETL